MVDFRYHLVSLISVFLALALGVVLGAGPLQAPIASGLTNQVQSLKESQARTSEEIEQMRSSVTQRNQWIDEVGRQVLPGTLKDKKVAFITLPDTGPEDVDAIREYVEVAGGAVNQFATLSPNWASEDLAQYRASLSGPVATHLAEQLPDDASEAEVLSQAVLEIMTIQSEETTLLREMLSESENALLSFEQDQTQSDAIIFIGPDQAVLPDVMEEETAPTEPVEVEAVEPSMWVALAGAVAKAPASGVVVGDASSADGIVALVRDQGIAVTSIESVGTTMAHVSSVVALLSADNTARAFGTASTAMQIVPPLPNVENVATSTQTTTQEETGE
ncbi:MAG: copper transporter [Actinomycetaceae bacterium]|nr:copper transporter [Actinomycetaceae bacterium]